MLLGKVEELVARTLDSVDLDRHDVLEDTLHHMILYSVCTEAHVWLEVATLGGSCFFSFLLEWLDIGRPRGGPISPTVINLEKT